MTTPRYLNSADAAVYLGYAPGERRAHAIRLLVHRRQIEHCKIGNRLRFDVRALDAWMTKSRVKADG
jgi:hypothetical protein